jgi:hypothetical protein
LTNMIFPEKWGRGVVGSWGRGVVWKKLVQISQKNKKSLCNSVILWNLCGENSSSDHKGQQSKKEVHRELSNY